MAMGRWRGERQGTLFIETEKLARSEGRTFYSALSEILSGNGFDRFCEEKVAAEKVFDEELGLPLHRAVFDWVLDVAAREGILKGRRVAVDSTMLQANASMKTIVRRCDGVSYRKYLEKLAKAEGIENPTKQDLQRLDRNRPGKKVSNRSWKSKTDKDARIARMKNGSTRMAYKAEHAVDVDSGV